MTAPSRRALAGHRYATLAYAVVTVVLAWASLRVVWGSSRFDLVMIAGGVLGIVAAMVRLAPRGRLLGPAVLLLGYLALAVTLAIPGTPVDGAGWWRTLREVVVGPVVGWKDVVTLPTPLGEYGATLVPAFALATLGAYGIVRIGAGSVRRWGAAAVVSAAVLVVAIAAGPAARRPLPWPAWVAARDADGALTASLLGLAGLTATVVWFRVRAAGERRAALENAGRGGQSRPVRVRVRTAARGGAAVALAAVAAMVAVSVALPVAADQPREVARTVVEPRLVIDAAASPLAAYRAAFADESFNAELLSVVVEAGEVERVRVATMPFYDGRTFSSSAPAGYSPLRFRHLPSPLRIAGDSATARITVAGLGGPWAPLPGVLGSVAFAGPRAAALPDTFYYAPDAASAVITADGGVAAGDVIIATAAADPAPALAAAGDSPARASIPSDVIPDSLRDWVDAQDVTRDGAGLATLVDTLRARGYLSHALTDQAAQGWSAALAGYSFVPSAAGHSYDRIDRLFTALNAREAELGGGTDAALVAAVGDDEQFAVATALLAAELGFPSRVVLGFRLQQTDPAGWTPAPCEGGICRGGNLSAWTEVQAASGEWIPVDVTPQHSRPPVASTVEQQDPEHPTATEPRRAEDIDAVAALKGRSGDESAPTDGAGAWLSGWARTVGAVALVLLLLLAAPAAILIAKAVRRGRRRRGTAAAVTEGGWDEYLDAAQDAGVAVPQRATRREIAGAFATANGTELAALADRATFTSDGVSVDDAERAWVLVAADRVELRKRRSWWRRLGTRLSTRSLLGRTPQPRTSRDGGVDAAGARWRAADRPSRQSATVGRR